MPGHACAPRPTINRYNVVFFKVYVRWEEIYLRTFHGRDEVDISLSLLKASELSCVGPQQELKKEKERKRELVGELCVGGKVSGLSG